jgi:hypothetical protein
MLKIRATRIRSQALQGLLERSNQTQSRISSDKNNTVHQY